LRNARAADRPAQRDRHHVCETRALLQEGLMHKIGLVLPCLLLGACSAEGGWGATSSALEPRDPAPGEETPGSSLVGALAGTVWQVMLPPGVALEKGALWGIAPARTPPELVGTLFEAAVDGSTKLLRIEAAERASRATPGPDDYLRTMDPSGSTWLYTI